MPELPPIRTLACKGGSVRVGHKSNRDRVKRFLAVRLNATIGPITQGSPVLGTTLAIHIASRQACLCSNDMVSLRHGVAFMLEPVAVLDVR